MSNPKSKTIPTSKTELYPYILTTFPLWDFLVLCTYSLWILPINSDFDSWKRCNVFVLIFYIIASSFWATVFVKKTGLSIRKRSFIHNSFWVIYPVCFTNILSLRKMKLLKVPFCHRDTEKCPWGTFVTTNESSVSLLTIESSVSLLTLTNERGPLWPGVRLRAEAGWSWGLKLA